MHCGIRVFLSLLFCLLWGTDARNLVGRRPLAFPPVGIIMGSVMKSRLGKNIYAFRGIRYGVPPVEHRRFMPPQAQPDFNHIFDATEDGPACPQKNMNFISEDCLRLNVYTTQLPSVYRRKSVKRPVIVFFHPSSFIEHSGQSVQFGPQYLMDKNVVLVTFNYRLGIFGFLATGDSVVPGNMGLMDQSMVLRWVQRNIAAFGGDPENVTIMGSSAGARSVILHLVSPMSKNLFHKAISMSGAPMKLARTAKDTKQFAKRQAKLLNCLSNNTAEMVACFRSKPMQDFIHSEDKVWVWHSHPMTIWYPVVEPKLPGSDRFLSDQPSDLIRQGEFMKVPLVIGVTKDELGCSISKQLTEDALKKNGTMLRQLNDYWYSLAPYCFLYFTLKPPQTIRISRTLRSFYLGDQPVNRATIKNVAQLFADSITNYPVHRTTKLIAENSQQPVYFYKFDFQGRHSTIMLNNSIPSGVCHLDDSQYIFYSPRIFHYSKGDAPETFMIETMTSIVENFAYTGQPIPKNNHVLANVVWERFNPQYDNYLRLGTHNVMATDFYPDAMRMWSNMSDCIENAHC